MEENEVSQKLTNALNHLVHNDAFLLESNANERSISHRLAVYLEHEFIGWDVDCEYNRQMRDPKRLHLNIEPNNSADTVGKTVFPDIIIHRRGTSDNLLVIEIKKTSSTITDDFDLHKLSVFKTQLGYQFTVFVKVITESNIGYEQPMWI